MVHPYGQMAETQFIAMILGPLAMAETQFITMILAPLVNG
jgi:hypothetical protein